MFVGDAEIPQGPLPSEADSSCGLIEELFATFQSYFRYYH